MSDGMDWREWKKHLTQEQWDAYVQGLIEANQDDLCLDEAGKPYYWAGPPNSGQGMPRLIWNDQEKVWEEGYPEDEEDQP